MEINRDEVRVKDLVLCLKQIGSEIIIVDHGLVQERVDTLQDDVVEVVVYHLGIDIESIDIVHLFLVSTCLFKNINVVKSAH